MTIDRQTRNRFRDTERVAHGWRTHGECVTLAPLRHKSFNGGAGGNRTPVHQALERPCYDYSRLSDPDAGRPAGRMAVTRKWRPT